MKYLIMELQGGFNQQVLNISETSNEAGEYLKNHIEKYINEDEILDLDSDFVNWEDDCGIERTIQIIEINC